MLVVRGIKTDYVQKSYILGSFFALFLFVNCCKYCYPVGEEGLFPPFFLECSPCTGSEIK